MQTLYQILGILAAVFIVWYLYRVIKTNPDAFSKESFSKSFSTMGFLALLLIGFIALLIMMLRAG